jgi:prophage regulatory protein
LIPVVDDEVSLTAQPLTLPCNDHLGKHEFDPNPARAGQPCTAKVVRPIQPWRSPMQRNPPERPSADTEAPALFLRIRTVVRMTGLGRSTIYRLMADKKFPTPVRLGPRAIAWRRGDLERWSEARPSATH